MYVIIYIGKLYKKKLVSLNKKAQRRFRRMTCVPTALLGALGPELKRINVNTISALGSLVRRDRSNVNFSEIRINGTVPTERHGDEFREHLRVFHETRNGQEVSTFDPLLAFMALKTKVEIVHRWRYRGVDLRIRYSPLQSLRTVTLQSNRGHMTF